MLNKLKIVVFSIWILGLAKGTFGTEYVPVYMWETTRHAETVPALDRISEESFKDLLLERLVKNPFVVIFAERNLSPEDFARHDRKGQTPFSNVAQLKSSAKVTYWPFVHSPIRAVKQLDKQIAEVSANDLEEDLIIPNDQVLIVDLNDAREDEDRLDMLRRHDEIIARIYKKVLEQNDNVLALYTAHHTSWVVSEDVRTHRRGRSLLATAAVLNETGLLYNTTEVMLYINASASYSNNNSVVVKLDGYTASATKSNNTVILQLSSTTKDVTSIEFIIQFSSGYWYLSGINVTEKATTTEYSLRVKEVYAPVGFSYHCTEGIFYGASTAQNLSLPKFQIQAYSITQNRTQFGFGDAYDCVGFTTAPIWSGLFVTFILALIMTFGLTFMMDIKTMDRFDDPKGKTITVNVTE